LPKRLLACAIVALSLAGCATGNPLGSALPSATGKRVATDWSGLLGKGVSSGLVAVDAAFVPGRALIRTADAEIARAAAGSVFGTITDAIPELGVSIVTLPKGLTVEAGVAALARVPGVEYAEPDYLAQSLAVPNDTYYGDQWGLPNVSAEAAWDVVTGNSAIKVGMVDSGIENKSGELAPGKQAACKNFSGTGKATDCNDAIGHGSHTGGIVAATTNNRKGMAGINWVSKLVVARVFGRSLTAPYSTVAAGIVWAKDSGAQVINMSLGGPVPDNTLYSAISGAAAAGVVLVASAGNDGLNTDNYPAKYVECIAVAATDETNGKAYFSNFGSEWVDVAAPGNNIWSMWTNGFMYRNSGTSMAAPFVSGLASLLYG